MIERKRSSSQKAAPRVGSDFYKPVRDLETLSEGEDRLRIISGNSNRALAEKIASHLGITLTNVMVKEFMDGETRVQLMESVRGCDCYVIQSTCPPKTNDFVMELLLLVDALRRASAKRVTAVFPYFGYGRQDRKAQAGMPVSARVMADLLQTVGIDRVLVLDLHAIQIGAFFNVPLDHLYGLYSQVGFIKSIDLPPEEIVIVSPDTGGAERARRTAELLTATIAIVDKRRTAPGESQALHLIGEVKGMTAFIVDDIVDSAGSLVQAVQLCIKEGARDVYAIITHPVLSGPAMERIRNSPLKQLVVSDSIPLGEECDKITVVGTGDLFASAIEHIHNEMSMKDIYSKYIVKKQSTV